MSGSGGGSSVQDSLVLNAVPLENAVLCAECDVVSDSPHDVCLVCGSHSLFNIARVFGGKLPMERATLVTKAVSERPSREVVLAFPKRHRPRRRTTAGPQQLRVVPFDDDEIDTVDRGMAAEPR
jgi:hypothetical protein